GPPVEQHDHRVAGELSVAASRDPRPRDAPVDLPARLRYKPGVPPRRLAMGTIRIGVIGDRDDSVAAHRAAPRARGLSRDAHRVACEWDWLPTTSLLDLPQDGLDAYHGFWAVPATPYRSAEGAMRAIRFARESGRAFLGTCGGFQQALLE